MCLIIVEKGLLILNPCLQTELGSNNLNTFPNTFTTSNTTIANTIIKDVTCILIPLQKLLTNVIEIDVLIRVTSQCLGIIYEYDNCVRKGVAKYFVNFRETKKSIKYIANIFSTFVIAKLN